MSASSSTTSTRRGASAGRQRTGRRVGTVPASRWASIAQRAMGRSVPARVLVIDNYDSFVYNLVQYLGELGAEPVVHRHDEITSTTIVALGPDAVLVSPGPGTPDDAGLSRTTVIRRVHRRAARSSACASGTSASARSSAAPVVRAAAGDARQDVARAPRRRRRLRRPARSVRGHPLPLADRGRRHACPPCSRSRPGPTTAPSWACATASTRRPRACSSTPSRSSPPAATTCVGNWLRQVDEPASASRRRRPGRRDGDGGAAVGLGVAAGVLAMTRRRRRRPGGWLPVDLEARRRGRSGGVLGGR